MKICILIPHLPMVPLPTEHTPKLPGEPLRGAESFFGTLSLPRLLLSVLNITALVMHWTAVKFQLLPPTVWVDTQPRKVTYKASYKSWLFIPSCAPVDSWLQQQGCGLGQAHLHPSTPPLVTGQSSPCWGSICHGSLLFWRHLPTDATSYEKGSLRTKMFLGTRVN